MITTPPVASSAPAGYRFPREVIAMAVRWYLRYGLSYRDVEELLAMVFQVRYRRRRAPSSDDLLRPSYRAIWYRSQRMTVA
jgi:hypothetical protein